LVELSLVISHWSLGEKKKTSLVIGEEKKKMRG
jgi:hypothetical protein